MSYVLCLRGGGLETVAPVLALFQCSLRLGTFPIHVETWLRTVGASYDTIHILVETVETWLRTGGASFRAIYIHCLSQYMQS
jgi:hypothetical protein